MSTDLRSRGGERILPGEAQNGGREMQFGAGNEVRVHLEHDGNPLTEQMAQAALARSPPSVRRGLPP